MVKKTVLVDSRCVWIPEQFNRFTSQLIQSEARDITIKLNRALDADEMEQLNAMVLFGLVSSMTPAGNA